MFHSTSPKTATSKTDHSTTTSSDSRVSSKTSGSSGTLTSPRSIDSGSSASSIEIGKKNIQEGHKQVEQNTLPITTIKKISNRLRISIEQVMPLYEFFAKNDASNFTSTPQTSLLNV